MSPSSQAVTELTAADDVPVVDFASAARAVLRQLKGRVGLAHWLVLRRQGQHFVVLDSLGKEYPIAVGDVLPESEVFCSRMLAGEAPRVAPSVADVPPYREIAERTGMRAGSLVTVPIPDGHGGVLGTVCGFDPEPRPADLRDHQPLVELLAGLLGALLVRELRLEREEGRAERAEHEAGSDPLTGVANRRRWDRALAAEEARCRRYGTSAAVVVVDVDGLKETNDRFGHDAGDQLLVWASRCLTRVAGADDVVARVGGDEFAVLAVDRDRAGALEVGVAIQTAFASADVGASVGVGVRDPAAGLTEAWRRADAEMYRLKPAPRAPARPPPAVDGPGLGRPGARLASRADVVRGGDGSLEGLLSAAREHLGMEVAVIARMGGGLWRLEAASAPTQGRYQVGLELDAEETYCQRVLDGRLPEVVRDSRAFPEAVALEAVAHHGIGSYLGVPLELSDGRTFGVLCCFRSEPDPSLNPRDAGFLRLLAGVASEILEREEGQARARHALVERLDRVLRPGGIEIVFQPIVELHSERVVGMEALSRFPDASEPIQEWFEAAATVGERPALELAAARAAVGHLDAIEGYLALNFSAETVLDPGFERLMDELPLHRVVVEISEHEPIADYGPVSEALANLRQRGLRLAVDDAGAGFASLAHVLRLHPDIIKLDVGLIQDIAADPARQALASALTSFGRAVGAEVVAEGVEGVETLRALRELGVDFGQGFHLGRPAAAPVR